MTVQESYSPVRKKPETLRLSGMMPALTVNDIEASLKWYSEVVGFTVEDEMKHEGTVVGGILKAGDQRLMLTQDDFAKGKDGTKGVGFRLYCTSRQDIDVLAQEIKDRGGELEQEPTDKPWGARDFSLVDPDGFRLTISTATD